jgi:hypothetical protein
MEVRNVCIQSCVYLSSKEIIFGGLHDGDDTVLRYMHEYTAMQNGVDCDTT